MSSHFQYAIKHLSLHRYSSPTLRNMLFFAFKAFRIDISTPSEPCVSTMRNCLHRKQRKKSLLSEMLISNRLTKLEAGNSGLFLSPLGLLSYYNRNGTKTNKYPKPNVYAEALSLIYFFLTYRRLLNLPENVASCLGHDYCRFTL